MAAHTKTPTRLILASLMLAGILFGYGSYDDAYESGMKLYKKHDWQGAARAFLQATTMAQKPEQVCNSQLLLGHAYRQSGDFNLARQAYARIVANKDASPSFLYHASSATARCAIQQKDHAAAARIYDSMLQLPALSPTKKVCVLGNKADAHQRLGQFDTAEASHLQALAVEGLSDRRRADVLTRYGTFLYLRDRYAESRQYTLKALALEDLPPAKQATIEQHLGLTWFAEKNYAQALTVFQNVSEHPSANARTQAEAMFYQGLCNLQLNQPIQARAQLEKLSTMKGAAKWQLKTACTQLERLNEAKPSQAITKNPTNQ